MGSRCIFAPERRRCTRILTFATPYPSARVSREKVARVRDGQRRKVVIETTREDASEATEGGRVEIITRADQIGLMTSAFRRHSEVNFTVGRSYLPHDNKRTRVIVTLILLFACAFASPASALIYPRRRYYYFTRKTRRSIARRVCYLCIASRSRQMCRRHARRDYRCYLQLRSS